MKQLQELRDRGIRLKQSLGQNLLLDHNLGAKLAAAADLREGDRVLEIGPGAGSLTEEILKTGASVLSVEIDGRLIPVLEERFAGEGRFRLVHADILKMPARLIEEFAGGGRIKVVSNLPFYSSSNILFQLADWRRSLSLAAVILQQELVERLVSGPGSKDYGILSVRLQAVSGLWTLFSLPASVFFPKPKIDARAVMLDFEKDPFPADLSEREFVRCVKAAFGQRRKMLSNTLGGVYGKKRALQALAECGIEPTARAETVEVPGYFRLASALEKNNESRLKDLPSGKS